MPKRKRSDTGIVGVITLPSWWSYWSDVLKYKGKRWELLDWFRSQADARKQIRREINKSGPGWRFEFLLCRTPAAYRLTPWAVYYRLWQWNARTRRWILARPWSDIPISIHVR